jgi:hypothetical protein
VSYRVGADKVYSRQLQELAEEAKARESSVSATHGIARWPTGRFVLLGVNLLIAVSVLTYFAFRRKRPAT